jgi:DNA-binding transcriptional regulator YdaS (Cro superfamily)
MSIVQRVLVRQYIEFCGSRKEAAKRLGVTEAMIGLLANGDRGVSAKIAHKIDADTLGAIPRDQLVFADLDSQRKSA